MDVIDICSVNTGIAVIISTDSFHILKQNEEGSIDVSVISYHSTPCTAVATSKSPNSTTKHQYNSISSVLPYVFVASHDALTSWSLSKGYHVQSCVKLDNWIPSNSSSSNAILQLSPCQSALSLCVVDSVLIFAVADNLGLAYCKHFFVRHSKVNYRNPLKLNFSFIYRYTISSS